MSNKQAKRDAEALRRAERDAMFPPSETSSESESDDAAMQNYERIATATMRSSRTASSEESEILELAEQAKLKVGRSHIAS